MSELGPLIGLLFNSQVIHDLENRGGMIPTGKLLIRQPEFYGNPTSQVI
jgi:hypothetical protein